MSLSDLVDFPTRSMRTTRLVSCLLLVGLLGITAHPAAAQISIPPQSFEEVVATAQEEQTPILVEIYASWCPYCQRMQNTVYSHSTVQEYLDDNFTYVRLNSDTTGGNHTYANRTLTTSQLASVLGARGVPTTVFMKPDGTPIARQPGFIKRPTFLTMIRFVGSGAYEDQSYKEFARQQSK